MVKKIAVDFNSTMGDEEERAYIGKVGSPYEDQSILPSLHPGEIVVLGDGEMEVQAACGVRSRPRGMVRSAGLVYAPRPTVAGCDYCVRRRRQRFVGSASAGMPRRLAEKERVMTISAVEPLGL